MDWSIRKATDRDIAAMQSIEVDAGTRFRDVGLDAIANDDPPSADGLAAHIADGTAWVAVAGGDVVVGYAAASVVDGEGHLDQVSVGLDAAGHGVGRELIETVHRWSNSLGHEAVTLTTFVDVAWNGPYYRRLGYEDVPADSMGPELATIRAAETAAGLDISPRVAMRRPHRHP